MWQKYDLDSGVAKQFYFGHAGNVYFYLNNDDFAAYSPAYLASNENVGGVIGILNPVGKTALSVVGSGDIPLFLSGFGARRVDTFDISIHAYIVMRMKMHMLQNGFDMKHYNDVLDGFSGNPSFTKSVGWKVLCDTFRDDKSVMQYLYDMNGYGILGSVPGNVYWKLREFEYARIKQFVPKSYKFMWTDLYNLSGRIGKRKYDIIYLSNILQYAGDNKKIRKTVDTLQSHLNPNGTIVLDSLNPMYSGEYDFLGNLHRDIIWNADACSVFLKTR